MGTGISKILAEIPLERNGELSLYQQVRSAIEMAIIVGELPDGSALPSVRRLAAALDVAPVTIVQAYRDLQAEQLIRSVPKRGYFVSVSPTVELAGPDLLRVQELIDEALGASVAVGLDNQAFLRLVSDRIKLKASGSRLIAVVGQRDAALAERVAVVTQSVADLPVQVIGLPFEELESGTGDQRSPDLSAIEYFLVPVGEVQRAAEMLGQYASRIMPMTRVLRADVREFISSQPPFTRFGIIAGSADLIGRILAVVRRLHHLHVTPMAVAVDASSDVDRVIREADALIIGSLAHPHLADALPPSKPTIEFVYVPDDQTLQRLRSRLLHGRELPAMKRAPTASPTTTHRSTND